MMLVTVSTATAAAATVVSMIAALAAGWKDPGGIFGLHEGRSRQRSIGSNAPIALSNTSNELDDQVLMLLIITALQERWLTG